MNGIIIKGLVPNTAVIDVFTAPDSMASRPDPETMQDRPRKPGENPATTLESTLYEKENNEND